MDKNSRFYAQYVRAGERLAAMNTGGRAPFTVTRPLVASRPTTERNGSK